MVLLFIGMSPITPAWTPNLLTVPSPTLPITTASTFLARPSFLLVLPSQSSVSVFR